MISRIGSKVAMTATLALSGAAAIAAQTPASAAEFSATYSCSIPNVGTEAVTVSAALTASGGPARAASPVRFDLSVTRLTLITPVAITSWSATADIAGSGAQRSAFRVTGSGGYVPAGQPITNANLTGRWTPTAPGTDRFTIGGITIHAQAKLLGGITTACSPTGTRPVTGTLTVR